MLLSGNEVLSLAMEIEKSGYAFYRTVAGDTPDAALRELFTFLAGEESRHYEFFRGLQSQSGDFAVDQEEWEETSRYIRATTDGRFFIGENRAIQAARGAGSAREAIGTALSFEKDTLLYFHEILAISPARSQDAARKIVDEEKRHVVMLSERRKGLGAEG
jgi:rubrerythrin